MFCNYCKLARPENEAPCPNCGAPSSLLEQKLFGGRGTAGPVATNWGAPATSFNEPWNGNQVPQVSFGSPNQVQNSPQQATDFQGQPGSQQQAWGSYPMPPMQEQRGVQPANQQPSFLPVPYQGNLQAGYQQNQMQLVPVQNGGQMLPAIPDQVSESIYVPPIYTKPRPIIPTYRVISGFLSIFIMAALLCGGSVYYAKATGKITDIQRLIGNVPPAPIDVLPAPKIPDPPNKVDTGPALNIITAAATTAHIDPNNLTPQQSDQIFQVNTTFYVTYSVKAPKPGRVVVKWYMNNQHFIDSVSDEIDPKLRPAISGDAKMAYTVPASGKVELYWRDRNGTETWAQTLYFAVR